MFLSRREDRPGSNDAGRKQQALFARGKQGLLLIHAYREITSVPYRRFD